MLYGENAQQALAAAKTLIRFRELEDEGLVRIKAEPEEESYFGVYGKPDGYTDINGKRVTAEEERKRICELIDRDGCWWVVTEYKANTCENHTHDAWEHADSVGMCIYDDPTSPFENCYVIGMMDAAIEKAEGELEEDEEGDNPLEPGAQCSQCPHTLEQHSQQGHCWACACVCPEIQRQWSPDEL
jgi:hypothetical protein